MAGHRTDKQGRFRLGGIGAAFGGFCQSMYIATVGGKVTFLLGQILAIAGNDSLTAVSYTHLGFAPKFDTVIVNDDLETAKAEALKVISQFLNE